MAILGSMLMGAAMPHEGDRIELEDSRNARSSGTFRPEGGNILYQLPAHTFGKIEQVKAFAGDGGYGLKVTLLNGDHRSEQVWIHYAPDLGHVTLCASSEGACRQTDDLDDARNVETQARTPAYSSPAVDDAVEAAWQERESAAADIAWVTHQMKTVSTAGIQARLECGPPALVQGACYQPRPIGLKPDFGSDVNHSTAASRQAFIDYMLSFALPIQAATKLPTSVLIAQAAIETGWGTSDGYRKRNAFFGASCTDVGSEKIFEIHLFGVSQDLHAHCMDKRPDRGPYYYVSFNRAKDSVALYASTLLSGSRYPALQQAVRNAPAGKAADWNRVADGLGAYDPKNSASYIASVKKTIRDYGLDQYDSKVLCH